MALQKTIKVNEFDITDAYIKVSSIRFMDGDMFRRNDEPKTALELMIRIDVWTSEGGRRAELSPAHHLHENVEVPFTTDGTATGAFKLTAGQDIRDAAYKYLKTLDNFSGALDV